jgi:sulfur carrier protein ThiS
VNTIEPMSAVRAAKLPLIIASLVLAWVLSGCSHTRAVGSDRTLRMAVTEYHLNPQSARVSSGTVAILVHNYGRLTHNLVVSVNGQAVDATKPIPPGQATELDLTLAPGTYLVASTIFSDQALGAYGTLTVTR